jgi:glycosyltransferase involved in cell wall biosynthesis
VNPKIAVLMCACNAEQYIKEAIDSILNQTFTDFEFIIVENGSTDKTLGIIESYSDPRIRAFRTDIKQLTYNLNYGLKQTYAELIARMDADDISEPTRLQEQVRFLEQNPDVAVVGTAFEVFGKDTRNKIIAMPVQDKTIRRCLPFRFCFCHPSVMFRKEIIENAGGYKAQGPCQDIELWLRLARDKKIKFANLKNPLLKYRIHQDQVKGKKQGYKATATYLFQEAVLQKSLLLLLGSLFTSFKAFFRAYK